MVRNARYDLRVEYFRKELGKADFFIIMVMVNTCCLIPYNSKWPLPSQPHFKCLTYVEFWVFWVPLWYPKIIMFKSMTFKLSNAVLHVPLWSLVEILHPSKDWGFLHNFQWKSHIFVHLMKYQKIMNIEWGATFDLGWLYRWLIWH